MWFIPFVFDLRKTHFYLLIWDERARLEMYDGLSKLEGGSERRFIENCGHFICFLSYRTPTSNNPLSFLLSSTFWSSRVDDTLLVNNMCDDGDDKYHLVHNIVCAWCDGSRRWKKWGNQDTPISKELSPPASLNSLTPEVPNI